MSSWRILAALAVIAGSGCDGEGAGPDTGADAGAPDADAEPAVAAPDIPWWNPSTGEVASPFQEMTCDPGYRLVREDGVAFCEPWPETGREDCPFGEAHFPGGSGCEPLGAPCPVGDFPEDLPSDATIIYVDDDAAPGGDGGRSSPYRRISEALGVASAGAWIAVARGVYDEAITISNSITVVGACAAESVIAPSFAGASSAVTLSGNAAVMHLGIRSFSWGIDASGESLHVTGVYIEGGTGVGIRNIDADLRLDTVVVKGVRTNTAGEAVGILLSNGQTTMGSVVVDDAEREGVNVVQGGILVFEGLTVVDTSSLETGASGTALTIVQGASVMGGHLLVERSIGVAVQIGNPDTVVELGHAIVRDTGQQFGGRAGIGLLVTGDATVDLSRAIFERNFVSALDVNDGAILRVSGFLIRDIASGDPVGEGGNGARSIGGTLSLSGGVIQNVEGGGILVTGEGTRLETRSLLVRDIGSDPDGAFGRGIGVQLGAVADLERTVVERAHELGIFVGGIDAEASLRDVVIRDMRSLEATGVSGRGVSVEVAAHANLERVLIERSRELGLVSMDGASEVTGTDVMVRGVAPRECATTTCPEEPFGTGLGSYYGASLGLTNFVVGGAELCGLQLAEGASIDLTGGVVSGTSIGACVQVDGYDLDRLSEAVIYRDNGTSLESTMLPIPEPH